VRKPGRPVDGLMRDWGSEGLGEVRKGGSEETEPTRSSESPEGWVTRHGV
jgi:hypothetical protein